MPDQCAKGIEPPAPPGLSLPQPPKGIELQACSAMSARAAAGGLGHGTGVRRRRRHSARILPVSRYTHNAEVEEREGLRVR